MRSIVTQIESVMEAALRPGRFIGYNASWDFVRGLEQVAARLKTMVDDGQPARAVVLYETFIAASHEKADEIDDSSGSFDMFVADLFCGWVRALQANAAEPGETVDLLLSWMDDDEYGFCHRLERDLVKVLDADGLGAFATKVRTRLEASAPDDGGPAGYPRRRWTEALKYILAAQADAEGYLALSQETALGSADCNVLAEIHQGRGRLEKALAWVERGLSLACDERFGSSAEYELKKRQSQLLRCLGRTEEAVVAAWADFENRPSKYTYETLLELVPDDDRDAWHDRAMAAADRGDLWSVIGLFVETGEVERLARRIAGATDDELEGMSHYTTEPAAKLLAQPHPALAARLRIVNAKKSKYYDAALANFEQARDCYLAAAQEQEWEELIAEVCREHGRKYSFMPGFERVAGGGPAREPKPSFLEHAKKRWSKGGSR